jgi:RecG-like helicase
VAVPESTTQKLQDQAESPPEKNTDAVKVEKTQGVEAETIQEFASRIKDDYEENEVRADLKYKGKKIEVVGTVQRIEKSAFGTPYIVMTGKGDRGESVQCMFNAGSNNELSKLKKGDSVNVIGKCDGRLLGTVMFSDCRCK